MKMNMEKLKSLRAFQKMERGEKRETPQDKRRDGLIRKMFRAVFIIVFILIVGGTGGIIVDRFGLPYLLVKFPELNKYEFLKSVNERTITIEKTVETKISEDRAVVEAIKKVAPSVVSITFSSKETGDSGEQKIGFILTSDGLVFAKTDRLAEEKNDVVKIKFQDNSVLEARQISFDKLNGAAIFKVEADNLPMVTFGDSGKLELGEKIIALGDGIVADALVSQIINDYPSIASPEKTNINPAVQKKIIITKNIPQNIFGAPLINIKGEIVGISEKENLIIPINEIRSFIDEVLGK